MQAKNSRGVQQDEVWAAADALLAERLRPTIERVRQKLGRGSPNTVAPMLEAWFASLGSRLGIADPVDALSAVPTTVVQAAHALWTVALTTAQEQGQAELAAQKDALEVEREQVRADRADLARQSEVAQQQLATMKDALSDSKRQLEEASVHNKELLSALTVKDQELVTIRQTLADAALLNNEERRRHDTQIQEMTDHNRTQAEQARAAERRLVLDIDRLRQALKKTESALLAQKDEREAELKELQQANQNLGLKYRNAELEIAGLVGRVAAGQARNDELQRLLEQRLRQPARKRNPTTAEKSKIKS